MTEKVVPFLHAEDGDAAKSFYCGKLGFREEWVYQPTPGALRCICLTFGSAKLYLSEMDETGKENKVVIWVDDLDSVLNRMDWNAVGGELVKQGHFCTRELRISDPDENTILFCERPEDGP